jgi:hypothetical protein
LLTFINMNTQELTVKRGRHSKAFISLRIAIAFFAGIVFAGALANTALPAQSNAARSENEIPVKHDFLKPGAAPLDAYFVSGAAAGQAI